GQTEPPGPAHSPPPFPKSRPERSQGRSWISLVVSRESQGLWYVNAALRQAVSAWQRWRGKPTRWTCPVPPRDRPGDRATPGWRWPDIFFWPRRPTKRPRLRSRGLHFEFSANGV